VLTDKQIEELYINTIIIDCDEMSSPLAESWDESFWDEREDNISREEWLDVLEIHKRKRREFIDSLTEERK
jgi:hypothetical protein